MRGRIVDANAEPVERLFGSVLAADARTSDGRVVLRKGTRLGPSHRQAILTLQGRPLHLVELEGGELEQDDVARRLAAAISGPGTQVEPAVQGQARVRAGVRGLVSIRREAVESMNRLHPLLVFTCAAGAVVLAGDDVAGAKSASLATPARLVDEAERIARAAPVVSVAAFERRRVAVVVTDRLEARDRALVRETVRRKIEWFGSELASFTEVVHDAEAIGAELRALLAGRVELVLVSGAASLDPFDPAFRAIAAQGGRIERTGVPAHPGSMVWVASIAAVPVLGIATCAGFGKETALDLVLARVLAGEDPSAAADGIGAGGLAEGAAPGSPFPPYTRSGTAATR